ncbi:MAG TPA: GAF domain-containing sensor histidine kinase [Bellilinea sp.]|nr:GAF domain-containing sensor histidine kinase [Bellilinea sp.]
MLRSNDLSLAPPVDIHLVLDDMAYTLLELSAGRQVFIFCRRGMSEHFDPVSAMGALSLAEKRIFWAATLDGSAPALLKALQMRPAPLWLDAAQRAKLNDPFLDGLSAPTWLVQPLTNRGALIGAVLLGWNEESVDLSSQQTRLLTTVVHSLELALENARLSEALSEKLQQNQSIQEITREILRKTDLQDVLRLAASGALRLVDGVGCRLVIYDERESPQVAYQVGKSAGLSPTQVHALSGGEELRQRLTPLVIENLTLENADLAESALLWLPLPADQVNLGWMEIYQQGRPITAKDIEAGAVFAGQAAMAIEHARLYRRVQSTAVAEERARMARELHDSISQALYAIFLSSGAADKQLNAGQTYAARASLDIVRNTSQLAMGEMRLLIYELRPPMLDRYGFCGAVQRRLQAVEQRAGLKVTLDLPEGCGLPPALEEPLYRIVQEALNNVIKHALASQVTVSLRREADAILLQVSDDGCGFDDKLIDNGGIGLKTMQERAELMHGEFTIHSAPQQGTTVLVRIPNEENPNSVGG